MRGERLERCRRAVELQKSGVSRKDIAIRFGIGEETVKALLRDGKFYAAPEADPERLEMAKRAAAARLSGMTRAAFADEARLTKGKADECWRDADVLFGSGETVSTTGEGVCP